jgi:hypothetical protein
MWPNWYDLLIFVVTLFSMMMIVWWRLCIYGLHYGICCHIIWWWYIRWWYKWYLFKCYYFIDVFGIIFVVFKWYWRYLSCLFDVLFCVVCGSICCYYGILLFIVNICGTLFWWWQGYVIWTFVWPDNVVLTDDDDNWLNDIYNDYDYYIRLLCYCLFH